ncbi:MAG: adenosylhomocysteinase [Planctomycetota bacterium]
MKQDVRDLKLASHGKKRILWADHDMPVLQLVRERFRKEKPLRGLRLAACLHITAETANLACTLAAGGAKVVLCASNPLSTQDDVAASLVRDFRIPVFAVRGEDNKTYYGHIRQALACRPNITMDDGADLVTTILKERSDLHRDVLGSMEETTTGVIRLRAMEAAGALRFPVIAVNDADTKHLFDNRYGTGQSTVDGIIRATDVLLAGKKVVAAGYGWCGRGFAMRARGMGATVIVTEVDPIRALEAAMDGFEVMTMDEAASIGEVFCTLTGDVRVLCARHFRRMKDGAILANSGHFNVEIAIEELRRLARSVRRNVRNGVDEYVMSDGRSLFLIAQGRLVNLAAAEGHPASVMDMSFAVQALASEHVAENRGKLEAKVYPVPRWIDEWVARLKLQSMGIRIDKLSRQQEKYLASWELGT